MHGIPLETTRRRHAPRQSRATRSCRQEADRTCHVARRSVAQARARTPRPRPNLSQRGSRLRNAHSTIGSRSAPALDWTRRQLLSSEHQWRARIQRFDSLGLWPQQVNRGGQVSNRFVASRRSSGLKRSIDQAAAYADALRNQLMVAMRCDVDLPEVVESPVPADETPSTRFWCSTTGSRLFGLQHQWTNLYGESWRARYEAQCFCSVLSSGSLEPSLVGASDPCTFWHKTLFTINRTRGRGQRQAIRRTPATSRPSVKLDDVVINTAPRPPCALTSLRFGLVEETNTRGQFDEVPDSMGHTHVRSSRWEIRCCREHLASRRRAPRAQASTRVR